MNKLVVVFWFSCIFAVPFITNAQERHFLKAAITVSPEVRSSYIKGGRLLLYLATELEKEPYKSPDISNYSGLLLSFCNQSLSITATSMTGYISVM
jgi:hypothetical protein